MVLNNDHAQIFGKEPNHLVPGKLSTETQIISLDDIHKSWETIDSISNKLSKLSLIADGSPESIKWNSHLIKLENKVGEIQCVLIDKLHEFWIEKKD